MLALSAGERHAATEQTVPEALNCLMEGKTVVVIAHHLSTIRHADIIFLVQDSELVERGTHEELLAAGGLYADLYRIQAAEGTADQAASECQSVFSA